MRNGRVLHIEEEVFNYFGRPIKGERLKIDVGESEVLSVAWKLREEGEYREGENK